MDPLIYSWEALDGLEPNDIEPGTLSGPAPTSLERVWPAVTTAAPSFSGPFL